MSTQRATIQIRDPVCAGAGTSAIQSALMRIPGVLDAYVNPLTDIAYIDYDPTRCTPAELTKALAAEGLRSGVPDDG
jgi:hypothetical protein